MKGDYPQFPESLSHEQLIEHFLLTSAEHQFTAQFLSGHSQEQSLALYRDLALSDVAGEYEQAMKSFPVK